MHVNLFYSIIMSWNITSFFQYEILTELKERRKQNSWGKMAEMPKKVKSPIKLANNDF